MKFIFVYITNPTKKEAEKIARHLLEKHLIACANIFPIESFYWWKKKIESGRVFYLAARNTAIRNRSPDFRQKMFEFSPKDTAKIKSLLLILRVQGDGSFLSRISLGLS